MDNCYREIPSPREAHPPIVRPGNPAIIRFTAPADGDYEVACNWTVMPNNAANVVNIEVWQNASANAEAGFARLFNEIVSGHNKSAVFKNTVSLKQGTVLLFTVKQEDGIADDAVLTDIVINKRG